MSIVRGGDIELQGICKGTDYQSGTKENVCMMLPVCSQFLDLLLRKSNRIRAQGAGKVSERGFFNR